MKNLTRIIQNYKAKHTTYIKGKIDCCLFVADVVKEATGIDYAENLRGKYTTVEEHKQLLKSINCSDIHEIPDILLKTPRKKGSEANYGDIVFWDPKNGNEGTLGICVGPRAYIFSLSGKMRAIPKEECLYSWELPK